VKIPQEILAILDNCRIEGHTVFLPPEQLDRKVYTAVNKCLENIGGKWNRSAKGHIFEDDPAEALEALILTGETEDMKKVYQFFPTPRDVAVKMCEIAELCEGSNVLEPSIGKGDLADVVWEYCGENSWKFNVFGIELNPDMANLLKEKPYTAITGVNFLDFAAEATDGKIKSDFTHVIMNPPFSKQQDISHIRSAFEMLRPGGILVSVASTSWQWRDNKKAVEFREWLDGHGAEIIELPHGSFKESGTLTPTLLIKLRRDGELVCSRSEALAPAECAPSRHLTFAEKFRLSKAS